MTQPDKDTITRRWTKRHATPSAESALFTRKMLQALAEGQPVTLEHLASITGKSVERLKEDFEKWRKSGVQINRDGGLVGDALTQIPTQHHFHVNDQHLYAWCALDTLFLPGLLGQSARIESSDPITGDHISLTVTPDGIADPQPSDIYLSIVDLDNSACCVRGETGPECAACSQMHFFSSYDAAAHYIETHPGTAIFTAQEAFQLARTVWIEPHIRAVEALADANK